jgi:hypothetical protein
MLWSDPFFGLTRFSFSFWTRFAFCATVAGKEYKNKKTKSKPDEPSIAGAAS